MKRLCKKKKKKKHNYYRIITVIQPTTVFGAKKNIYSGSRTILQPSYNRLITILQPSYNRLITRLRRNTFCTRTSRADRIV